MNEVGSLNVADVWWPLLGANSWGHCAFRWILPDLTQRADPPKRTAPTFCCPFGPRSPRGARRQSATLLRFVRHAGKARDPRSGQVRWRRTAHGQRAFSNGGIDSGEHRRQLEPKLFIIETEFKFEKTVSWLLAAAATAKALAQTGAKDTGTVQPHRRGGRPPHTRLRGRIPDPGHAEPAPSRVSTIHQPPTAF